MLIIMRYITPIYSQQYTRFCTFHEVYIISPEIVRNGETLKDNIHIDPFILYFTVNYDVLLCLIGAHDKLSFFCYYAQMYCFFVCIVCFVSFCVCIVCV